MRGASPPARRRELRRHPPCVERRGRVSPPGDSGRGAGPDPLRTALAARAGLRIVSDGGGALADSILTRARPLLAARLAGAALAIAVPMVLARVLLPAAYGTFKQAWLVSQTLALMLPMGLTQSLYYFVPREPKDARSLRRADASGRTPRSALVAALLVLGGPRIPRASLPEPRARRAPRLGGRVRGAARRGLAARRRLERLRAHRRRRARAARDRVPAQRRAHRRRARDRNGARRARRG